MDRIVIQNNCEVLSLQKDPKEKGVYDVQPLFSNEREEFSPEVPLKVKGSPQEVAKILSFLGEQFSKDSKLKKTLNNLSIAPVSFEMRGEEVVATDARGRELSEIEGNAAYPPSSEKVDSLIKTFFPAKKKTKETAAPSDELLMEVGKVKSLWAELNITRTSKEKRIEKKISLLEDFIRNLARKKGMPEEEIEAGLEALEGSSSSFDYLNRAKLQYFPELADELHELQMCDECKDHLKLL